VPEDLARSAGLTVGRPLDADLHQRLTAAADAEAAFRTLLRALERRAFARTDLGRRLIRKGHPRPAVEAALERAQGLGLLDDCAFARSYVETRTARGRGPSRLTRDLMAMGVERSAIDRALAAEWPEGSDRTGVPQALAVKRAAQLGDLPRPVKRRRVLAFLARRGFAGRDISDMVSRLVG
jgi:regulatory protein